MDDSLHKVDLFIECGERELSGAAKDGSKFYYFYQ